jgi:hypothetical protein
MTAESPKTSPTQPRGGTRDDVIAQAWARHPALLRVVDPRKLPSLMSFAEVKGHVLTEQTAPITAYAAYKKVFMNWKSGGNNRADRSELLRYAYISCLVTLAVAYRRRKRDVILSKVKGYQFHFRSCDGHLSSKQHLTTRAFLYIHNDGHECSLRIWDVRFSRLWRRRFRSSELSRHLDF